MLPLQNQISTHRKLDKTNWTERVKFLEDLWKKWNRFAFRNIILHCGKKDTYYLKTGELFYQLFGKCLYVWIFKRNRRHFFVFLSADKNSAGSTNILWGEEYTRISRCKYTADKKLKWPWARDCAITYVIFLSWPLSSNSVEVEPNLPANNYERSHQQQLQNGWTGKESLWQ